MFLDLHGLGEDVAPEVIKELPHLSLADIGPDPDQPRKVFERSKIAAMTAQFLDPSIGQLEAITVRHNPAGVPKFLIVSGENRYRAAIDAKWKTIKADIVETSSFVHQVLSNETRTDMTAFDKAKAYQSLIDDYGYSAGGVAALLGRHGSYISEHTNLIDLPEVIVAAANDGKANTLAVLTALRIVVKKFTSPANKVAIQEFIDSADDGENVITSRSVTEFAKTLKSRKKPKAAPPKIDGKAFKVVSVNDDVMTIKRTGEKTPSMYRLVRIAEPD